MRHHIAISGSLVALVTPMLPDGAIDWPAFRGLIDWHIEQGTDGLVIMGSTGETPTIVLDDHLALIEEAVRYAAGRIPVIGGTGANSTAEAVELTRAAWKVGVAACLSVVPYYNKPTQDGIYRHFRSVADSCEAPLILYDVPGRTISRMEVSTVVALSQLDGVVGLKDATADMGRANELLAQLPSSFSLYSGDDASAGALMLLGACGTISVAANILPALMHEFCTAALAQDVQTVRRLGRQLASVHHAMGVETNPIPVKWALARMGRIQEGIRLPLTPLAPEYHDLVDQALASVSRSA